MEIAVVAWDKKARPRGARSSAWLVVSFFAVVVDIGWPTMVVAAQGLAMISSLLGGGGENGDDSNILAYAVGMGSLGLVWIAMAHLVRRSLTCAILQIGAVGALSSSLALYIVCSRSPALTAVTALPFGVAASFKLGTARALVKGCKRSDYQFSLRELFCFILSLSALLLPVAQSSRASAPDRLDPNSTTVLLVAYGVSGEIVEEKRLSFDDYMWGTLPIIESDEYRANHGVRSVVITVVTREGRQSVTENYYGANGQLADRPARTRSNDAERVRDQKRTRAANEDRADY